MKIYTETDKITFTTTLQFFEKNMPHDCFQRTHLSHIINFDKAKKIKLSDRTVLVSRNQSLCEIPISKTYFEQVKNRLNIMRTRKKS